MVMVITGPGIYVMRNGDLVAITEIGDSLAWDWAGARWLEYGRKDRGSDLNDILRRATASEIAAFCGEAGE